MYDPTVGRWLSQDPEGFAAGDSNLYRYCDNGPTEHRDPSGLDYSGRGGASDLTAIPIGGPYRASILIDNDYPTTPAQREAIRAAFFNAAERIRRALYMLDDNWAETTHLYRFSTIQGPNGPVQIESQTWQNINQNRQLLIDRLRRVYNTLLSESGRISFSNRQGESHPELNPMYTSSWNLFICEIGGEIRCRSHYWNLPATGGNSQEYYTIHELGRLMLRLNDDSSYANGQGVQRWDGDIQWLADNYDRWNWRDPVGEGGDW